mgnify:CR=1 FL=1
MTHEKERSEKYKAQEERRLNLVREYYATYIIGVPEIVLETGSQKKVSDYVDEYIIQHMDIDGLSYDLEDVTEG